MGVCFFKASKGCRLQPYLTHCNHAYAIMYIVSATKFCELEISLKFHLRSRGGDPQGHSHRGITVASLPSVTKAVFNFDTFKKIKQWKIFFIFCLSYYVRCLMKMVNMPKER